MTRRPVCLPRMKAVKLGLRPLNHRGYADLSTSVSVTRLEAVNRVSPICTRMALTLRSQH
jgi:hypothetical protein